MGESSGHSRLAAHSTLTTKCNGAHRANGAESQARFRECCQVKLSLDETSMQQAMRLYELTAPFMSEVSGVCAEEVEKLWWGAILFVVKQTDTREKPGFTLSQILNAVNISIVDFCKDMPQFLLKCGASLKAVYGKDVERRMQVTEVQALLVHLLILFNFFKRVYQAYFVLSEAETQDSSFISMPKRFGWLLFLALRVKFLGTYPDLVTCTLAILAVLATMIIHMPASSRSFTIDDLNVFPRRDSRGVNLIASLAQYADACEEDLQRVFQKAQAVIAQLFPNLPTRSDFSHVPQLHGFNTEGLTFFEGLMDEHSLGANVAVLDKNYELAYSILGDLDERLCLREDDAYHYQLAGAGLILQRGETQATSVPGSVVSSPARRMPSTPVAVTMSTAKWLRTVIGPLQSEPGPELLDYFKSCDRDIGEEVASRAKTLLDGIFPTRSPWRSNSSDGLWTEHRRLEAAKLYYRVLTSVCRAESQRLHSRNLSSVLMNEKFHRCMLTCAAELVLATHKTVTMTFPAVLESTGITAFDLTKVIELYVRHEETLPRDLKRHLNSIEERLIESMAWERGSAMYNSLAQVTSSEKVRGEIQRLGLLADPMPPLEALRPEQQHEGEGATSPEREALPAAEQGGGGEQARQALVSPARERTSAFSAYPGSRQTENNLPIAASPARPNSLATRGETCADTTITMFLQKVLKLAAIRIKNICDRLQQPPAFTEDCYRAFKTLLDEHLHLFFNRHVDQIILCVIYGIAKVFKKNVTFKVIIFHYRKLPHAKTHVFRHVFIDIRSRGRPGYESSDIIRFYNEHFVKAAKAILQAGPWQSQMEDKEKNNNTSNNNNGAGATGGAATTTGGAVTGDENPPPGSPKPSISTFPSLPDMSPKKVSAQHNVFVSPLRNTKADNIMSPHSRSLYACLGESTHAYQSPSRDLTVINNRLNNRRCGRLDFEGASMMSDSDAAGAFSPPPPPANGSHSQRQSSASEPAAPESPPHKRAKLDR